METPHIDPLIPFNVDLAFADFIRENNVEFGLEGVSAIDHWNTKLENNQLRKAAIRNLTRTAISNNEEQSLDLEEAQIRLKIREIQLHIEGQPSTEDEEWLTLKLKIKRLEKSYADRQSTVDSGTDTDLNAVSIDSGSEAGSSNHNSRLNARAEEDLHTHQNRESNRKRKETLGPVSSDVFNPREEKRRKDRATEDEQQSNSAVNQAGGQCLQCRFITHGKCSGETPCSACVAKDIRCIRPTLHDKNIFQYAVHVPSNFGPTPYTADPSKRQSATVRAIDCLSDISKSPVLRAKSEAIALLDQLYTKAISLAFDAEVAAKKVSTLKSQGPFNVLIKTNVVLNCDYLFQDDSDFKDAKAFFSQLRAFASYYVFYVLEQLLTPARMRKIEYTNPVEFISLVALLLEQVLGVADRQDFKDADHKEMLHDLSLTLLRYLEHLTKTLPANEYLTKCFGSDSASPAGVRLEDSIWDRLAEADLCWKDRQQSRGNVAVNPPEEVDTSSRGETPTDQPNPVRDSGNSLPGSVDSRPSRAAVKRQHLSEKIKNLSKSFLHMNVAPARSPRGSDTRLNESTENVSSSSRLDPYSSGMTAAYTSGILGTEF